MATIDGSIQLVKVVTDVELRQNGGSFVVVGRMAQPIQGFDTLTKRASGGNAIPVYVVSDAQIANGTFRLKGGSALPMADIDVVGAGVKTIQDAAIPVYVVSGSEIGVNVPNAPANLTATAASGSQIDLEWDASADATGYKIERSDGDDQNFAQIDTVGEVEAYEDTGLDSGIYYYRIRATNAAGDSDYSNISSATITWYDGLTNLVAVYQPIGASSLAASYVNLVNPGVNDAAPGVAPTWSAVSGWAFNGTTQYLATSVSPVNDQTWSILIRFSNATVSGGVVIGRTGGATSMFITPRVASSTQRQYSSGSSTALAIAGAQAAAVMAIAGNLAYLNGVAEIGTLTAGSGSTAITLFIGATSTPAGSSFYAGNVLAVAICSSVQTADQIAAASAAMAAL